MLLWQRARDPYRRVGAPGRSLGRDETLEQSIRRHLAAKVDVRELAHLEQLETLAIPVASPTLGARDRVPRPRPRPTSTPSSRPTRVAPRRPPAGACVRPRGDGARRPASDCEPSSPTRTSASRSPPRRSRSRSCGRSTCAALGYHVSATNLRRMLLRRRAGSHRARRREPGRVGGRPAALFRLPHPDARDHRPVRRASPAVAGG